MLKFKLTLYLVLLLVANNLKAQYGNNRNNEEIKHHQISLNGSTSAAGLLFKIDGKFKRGGDSLSYKGRSTPAIQLGYDYFFKRRISFGLMGSTQSMGMEVDYLIFKNENGMLHRFNNFDIKVKRRYIGLKFNYHVINNLKNDLYLGARFGAVFWKITPSIKDADLDNKLFDLIIKRNKSLSIIPISVSFPGLMFPALAMGYKYKIREKVGVGVELSLGIPQLFSYGIDYRF